MWALGRRRNERRGRGEVRGPLPLWEQDWVILLTAASVGLPVSILMWLASEPGWVARLIASLPFVVSLVAGYFIRALGRFVDRKVDDWKASGRPVAQEPGLPVHLARRIATLTSARRNSRLYAGCLRCCGFPETGPVSTRDVMVLGYGCCRSN